MEYTIRPLTIEDYDKVFALWNGTEQSRRALNPIDDSREGIGRYLNAIRLHALPQKPGRRSSVLSFRDMTGAAG